jgi:DNA-binding transcriptional MerR regulator
MKSTYSIKDLERLSGIKAHTIRIWEQRHKIIEPKRTDTNIRFYCDDDLRRLLNVSYLVLEGVKISQVASLSEEQLHTMVYQKASRNSSYTTELNDLKLAMFAFDEGAFNQAFQLSVTNNGEEITFTNVLGSFISELGILWQTNTVNIAHEHFVSNLIKQKLFAAIDNCTTPSKESASKVLLYLPANELHEIGLLYLAFLLKKRGIPIISMGQNTPSEYLREVYAKTKFEYAISVFTTHPNACEVEEYFGELNRNLADLPIKFLFCGAQLSEVLAKGDAPANIFLYKNVAELQNSILFKE